MRTITFNELRKIKDSLPSGSMHRIADELGLHVDTVRILDELNMSMQKEQATESVQV